MGYRVYEDSQGAFYVVGTAVKGALCRFEKRKQSSDDKTLRSGCSERGRVAAVCALHPTICPYYFEAKWDHRRSEFVLTEYNEHSERCQAHSVESIGRRCAVHYYTASQLAPVLLKAVEHGKKKLLGYDYIRSILADYVQRTPTNDFCDCVRNEAQLMVSQKTSAGTTTPYNLSLIHI